MALQKKSASDAAPSVKDAISVDPTARVASHHGRMPNTVMINKSSKALF
jgi:hypothetical protein